ncbi:thiamine transporter 2-like [Asterias amurensis]|uniref:thiamine transporter 2-like n=1 Tax=Asterias amurensis TaxID=7602 RepID=UPI003AB57AAE
MVDVVRRGWANLSCHSSAFAWYTYRHPKRWILATALICLYGFFKAMRPSEPFLTPYLIEVKNISEGDLDNVVYPYWTYSYMVALVPVFLFTDALRYKPVVVFEGLTFIGTWGILLWGEGVLQMIFMQFLYGFATATEIAYYAYIFAAVPREKFQQVSSYTRSSILTGKFIAGALGQLLISLKVTSYYGLNVISMVSVFCSLFVALALPSVRQTLYFHRGAEEDRDKSRDENRISSEDSKSDDAQHAQEPRTETESGSNPHQETSTSLESSSGQCSTSCRAFRDCCWVNFAPMWSDFKNCYGDFHLLKWSLWWAFATCGDYQVGNYIQNLWEIIFKKPGNSDLDTDLYNGAVEAITTLTGALSAFLIMFVQMDWRLFGELLLGVVSLLDAAILVAMGVTGNIWLCYVLYIVFRSSYQLVITIATYQIAKYLAVERYALVFGLNMFIAMVLGSILTFVVVDSRTLNTPADTQFVIYGGYFFILGCAFCFKAVYTITAYGWGAAWRARREMGRLAAGNLWQDLPVVPVEAGGVSTQYKQFQNETEHDSDV